uniref:Uncharacterized protein n=1 Tax=Panagrellus redivivus TaxID=6233 RepID=A0A7E4VKM5_PANRE
MDAMETPNSRDEDRRTRMKSGWKSPSVKPASMPASREEGRTKNLEESFQKEETRFENCREPCSDGSKDAKNHGDTSCEYATNETGIRAKDEDEEREDEPEDGTPGPKLSSTETTSDAVLNRSDDNGINLKRNGSNANTEDNKGES